MKITEVAEILDARLICGTIAEDDEVHTAFAADLMSDVLAFVKEDTLILTGMVNTHVVRTAEMLDVRFVVFVRGKMPNEEMIEMANEQGLVMLATNHTLFSACGLLYTHGLKGCTLKEE